MALSINCSMKREMPQLTRNFVRLNGQLKMGVAWPAGCLDASLRWHDGIDPPRRIP